MEVYSDSVTEKPLHCCRGPETYFHGTGTHLDKKQVVLDESKHVRE